jgi:asparagine synthase (glutamine-hydrolysing)
VCGIAASINFPFNTNSVFKHMGHRGPDEQNGLLIDNVQLYHLRLSILDISTGQQPMHYLDRYTIIFNGEIYNYKELKAKYNLICKTNSDTEVILQLFHKLGMKMLNEFDGMFAFIIYDSFEKKIFLVRDRAGKKPIYLFKVKDEIFIASELNCIKATCNVSINEDAIATYFRTGMYIGTDTCYKEVYEIPKGSFTEINCNSLTIQEKLWWNIQDYYSQKTNLNFSKAKEQVKENLQIAIKRRMESSDVEVGTFLSGGIDSGLITAYACQFNSNIKTFTVSFPGIYNEAPYAEKVAKKFNTHHQTISLDFSHLESDIENILSFMENLFLITQPYPATMYAKKLQGM